MNTSEVAKLLGVSPSTIKRWVKQLELPMDRNERGHYQFNNEVIEFLKANQEKINNSLHLNEVAAASEKNIRSGVILQPGKDPNLEKLRTKIVDLERILDEKADSVISYQLLQHRREIEDLQNLVSTLSTQISQLTIELQDLKQSTSNDLPLVLDHPRKMSKTKRKNLISTLFGF